MSSICIHTLYKSEFEKRRDEDTRQKEECTTSTQNGQSSSCVEILAPFPFTIVILVKVAGLIKTQTVNRQSTGRKGDTCVCVCVCACMH